MQTTLSSSARSYESYQTRTILLIDRYRWPATSTSNKLFRIWMHGCQGVWPMLTSRSIRESPAVVWAMQPSLISTLEVVVAVPKLKKVRIQGRAKTVNSKVQQAFTCVRHYLRIFRTFPRTRKLTASHLASKLVSTCNYVERALKPQLDQRSCNSRRGRIR